MMKKGKNNKADIIGNGEVMKKAWAIRKETAAEYGVDSRFIHFGSCVKAAAGTSKAKITDVWGSRLGSVVSEINRYLLSGDCPVIVDTGSISKITGASGNLIYAHLSNLKDAGKVNRNYGYHSVKLDARPYPHETPEAG